MLKKKVGFIFFTVQRGKYRKINIISEQLKTFLQEFNVMDENEMKVFKYVDMMTEIAHRETVILLFYRGNYE
jgi:hypothetical protein